MLQNKIHIHVPRTIVYMNFYIKKFNVCGITRARGGGRPPPMFRTIPPEGHPVNRKKTIYFGG